MKKSFAILITLLLAIGLSGCAGMQQREQETEETAKRAIRLEEKNRILQSQLTSMDTKNEKLRRDLKLAQSQNKKFRIQNKDLMEKKYEVKTKKFKVEKIAIPPFSMKVLSGTGNIMAAKKMSKRLYDMGYRARGTGKAPRKFKHNVVFYAKGFKDLAGQISQNLGGKTKTKRLSWKSKFDIIVVAGKKN